MATAYELKLRRDARARARHRDKRRAYNRRYKKEHPEAIRAQKRRRRVRERLRASAKRLNKAVDELRLAAQRYRSQRRGRKDALRGVRYYLHRLERVLEARAFVQQEEAARRAKRDLRSISDRDISSARAVFDRMARAHADAKQDSKEPDQQSSKRDQVIAAINAATTSSGERKELMHGARLRIAREVGCSPAYVGRVALELGLVPGISGRE